MIPCANMKPIVSLRGADLVMWCEHCGAVASNDLEQLEFPNGVGLDEDELPIDCTLEKD